MAPALGGGRGGALTDPLRGVCVTCLQSAQGGEVPPTPHNLWPRVPLCPLALQSAALTSVQAKDCGTDW